MPNRLRSYSTTAPKGTAVWHFGGNHQMIGGSYPIITSAGSVSDEVQNGDNNPFHTRTVKLVGGRINGEGNSQTTWTNYIADAFESLSQFGHLTVDGSPSNGQAADEGVGRTNPSNAPVQPIIDISKLGDTMSLIHQRGTDWLSKVGETYIKYEFAVRPVIEDLIKMHFLKRSINRRCKQIIALQSQGGYRKSVTVFKGSARSDQQSAGHWAIQTNFGFFDPYWSWITTEEVRVHCRWLPEVEFPWDIDDNDVVAKATRSLLGAGFNMKLIWDITPWSWLINWASNVGTFIASNNNALNCFLSYCTVMRHQRSEIGLLPCYSDGPVLFEGAHTIVEDKDRMLWPVTPVAKMPILDSGQLAIAGSLVAQDTRTLFP